MDINTLILITAPTYVQVELIPARGVVQIAFENVSLIITNMHNFITVNGLYAKYHL